MRDIVKRRWDYAHSDIHSAGFCLDPEFWHIDLNQEVTFIPMSWALISAAWLLCRRVFAHVSCSIMFLQNGVCACCVVSAHDLAALQSMRRLKMGAVCVSPF